MTQTEYLRDKALFKKCSDAATTRQAIYALLTANPTRIYSLKELALAVAREGHEVYDAVKQLTLKGFSERKTIVIPNPPRRSLKKPEGVRKLTGICLVRPWSPSKAESWIQS